MPGRSAFRDGAGHHKRHGLLLPGEGKRPVIATAGPCIIRSTDSSRLGCPDVHGIQHESSYRAMVPTDRLKRR